MGGIEIWITLYLLALWSFQPITLYLVRSWEQCCTLLCCVQGRNRGNPLRRVRFQCYERCHRWARSRFGDELWSCLWEGSPWTWAVSDWLIWYRELIYSLTCCFGEVIALLDVFEVSRRESGFWWTDARCWRAVPRYGGIEVDNISPELTAMSISDCLWCCWERKAWFARFDAGWSRARWGWSFSM